jgi:hypothetical protein
MSQAKSFLIIAIFLVSIVGGPAMLYARAQDPPADPNAIDTAGEASALQGALGQIFGMFRGFGASGEALGKVLQMMFTDFQNMTNTKKVDGLYVLNASMIFPKVNGTHQYTDQPQEFLYQPSPVYNLLNANNPALKNEFPFFHLSETGNVSYNVTEGVQVVFTIWDQDQSFINAIDKLLNAIKAFAEVEANNETETEKGKQAISIMAEMITYFLIHINDIITGDEVIVLNINAFSNYEADFDFVSNGKWYYTKDQKIPSRPDWATRELTDAILPNWNASYQSIANTYNDEIMNYLLNDRYVANRYQNYTAFSFDILQLWLKNFQISIDVAAILKAVQEADAAAQSGEEYNAEEGALAGKTATDIFQELDIEFYIFTHSFQNWYLYDDNKFSDTNKYNETSYPGQPIADMINNNVPDVLFNQTGTYEGEPVYQIVDSEVEYYLLMRGADSWSFKDPIYDSAKNSMEWGIRANNLDFRCIPMGMKEEEVDEIISPVETMEYMELGFKFEPWSKNYTMDTAGYVDDGSGEVTVSCAKVKLDQAFGEWNGGAGPNTGNVGSKQLDLATVFMSTILHVHLHIENEKLVTDGETPDAALLAERNYNEESHEIKVGNQESKLPLAQIDIKGPKYQQTASGSTTVTEHEASSTIIPLVYAQGTARGGETYTQSDNSTGAVSVQLDVEFSVLLYAISFSTFDGTGDAILHDPTFSVFFVTQSKGFLAIILIVAMIALVGIAAVLITKKKNKNAMKNTPGAL